MRCPTPGPGQDGVELYIRAAKRYPLLDRDEEHALAVAWFKRDDKEAMQRLVACNLRLVIKLANRYAHKGSGLLDLIQEGNIGLLKAVRKFDPHRGAKLSTYAAWWIRAYLLRHVLQNFRLVRVGTTNAQRRLFFNLRREQARLRAVGIDPEPERLASILDVSTDDVRSMDAHMSGYDESFDVPAPTSTGAVRTRADLIPDERIDVAGELERAQLAAVLHTKLRTYAATLTGRDRDVFSDRWLAENPITFEKLGQRWGLSRERARQLELRMREPLRRYLHQEMGDAV
ncbi:MAG: RNA polymerase factor sigma-32 [Nannocystaceae bacterium]